MAYNAIPWSINAILVIILIWVFINPEKAQMILSWVLGLFRYVSHRIECKHVSTYIESRLNDFSKNFNAQSEGISPYKMRIEWAREASREAFIKGNEVVVKMGFSENQDKNFVTATLAYVPRGVIPHSRSYIDKNLSDGIDLLLARKIILKEKVGNAIDYFINNILDPVLRENEEIRDYCNRLETIDDMGLFDVILLREFLELGRRLHPKMTTDAIINESREFLKFLHGLATKERGVNVNPDFEGENIRISVVLVARYGVVDDYGYKPYLERVKKCISRGVDTIYLAGIGKNIEDTIAVSKIVRKQIASLEKIKKALYKIQFPDGKKNDAMVVIFRLKNNFK